MTDDELRDLLALVALDALDPAEQEAAESAIANRPELQGELDDLREVVALLAEDDASEPPAALKASILAEIAITEQSTHSASPPLAARAVADAPEPEVAQPSREFGPDPPLRSSPTRGRWTAAIAIAAAAVVVAIGATVWITGDSPPSEADQVDSVLELADVEALELHGVMEGVRIMHSPSSTAAVLVADGMPDPGEDLTYQLWFNRNGVAAPANVFRPDPDGHVEVLLEDFAPAGAVITVTVEPVGGSDEPTSPTLVRSPE